MQMIFNSLTFWTLLAGILAFVAKFFFPAFPLGSAEVLALVLFFLGLVNVVPQARRQRATFGDLLKSMAFWQMIAGFLSFIALYFFPQFPLDSNGVLGIVLFILALFGINPELRLRGLRS